VLQPIIRSREEKGSVIKQTFLRYLLETSPDVPQNSQPLVSQLLAVALYFMLWLCFNRYPSKIVPYT